MTAARRASSRRPPPDRTERLRLCDGRDVCLRPIDPADAEPIAGGFVLLDDEEVRRRFLHPVKALSAEYLQRLVQPAPGQAFVIVASEPLPPGLALIGAVARVSRDAEGGHAEFAILVSHYLSGQGLGRVLMQRLIDWARTQDIAMLWGDVADDNTAMLALAQRLGFQHESVLGTPGVQRVTLALRRARPSTRTASTTRRGIKPGRATSGTSG